MSFLKAFTTQINNLIIELSEVLPYNKDIAVNKTAIELIIKTNPRLMYTTFMKYIMPYKSQIIERDDAFFLSRDINESDTMTRQIVTTLNILRESWKSLTQSTRDNVWLYFSVLIKLAEKIAANDAV